MSPPVICIAGHRYYTEKHGGVELQTKYLGEVLAKSGWEVAFLSPSLNKKSGKEEIDKSISVWWYPHFSFTFQTPRKLIEKMLDSIRPDVFYQRGRGQLTNNNLILRYANKISVPFVFAFSSDADLYKHYEIRMTLNSFKPLWKRVILIPYAMLLDKTMNNIIKKAGYIVVQHEGQAEQLQKKFNRKSYLLRTIHQEVKKEVNKSNQNLILWVNNYRPMKQGELYIQLAERLSNLNCRFVMVYGRTKEKYIRPIIERGKEQKNLVIFGEMTSSEVEALMEKSILFVNTSLPYEGFPNTFVQSWLRETPTVSLNVDPGGVITRKKIGFFSGSFEQLVKDVIYLIENDQERIEMGKRARAYAERKHGFEHNKDKIVDFFSKTVSKPQVKN